MALLDNRDPERVPALIAALPAPIRADLQLWTSSVGTFRDCPSI